MELGRKHRVCTLLNPAPATTLDDAILQNVDVLTPNESELRILLGLSPDASTSDLDLARHLQKRGVKTVVVTRGEKGALIIHQDKVIEIPGIGVDVVDTTGAGDAFSAGLAVALAEKKELVEAVQFANCSGALACTKLGVIPALAERELIERLYRKHYSS